MKTRALLLAFALSCRSLLAGDSAPTTPAPCCAAKPPAASEISNPKSQIPTDAPAPCCAASPAPTSEISNPSSQISSNAPAPCCAASPAASEISNPKSQIPTDAHANHRELPAAGFSRESLYQLDATFTDDAGRPFALGSLRGRPVVLTMFFASCNYACPMLVADIARIRSNIPAAVRDSAQIVLVSFDVARDTPAALRQYREARQLDAQWTLLHGDDDAVAELAALLGVKFKQEADGQFAHSNLITILNAQGEIVHQRAGLSGGLYEAAAALVALK